MTEGIMIAIVTGCLAAIPTIIIINCDQKNKIDNICYFVYNTKGVCYVYLCFVVD